MDALHLPLPPDLAAEAAAARHADHPRAHEGRNRYPGLSPAIGGALVADADEQTWRGVFAVDGLDAPCEPLACPPEADRPRKAGWLARLFVRR